MPSSHALLSASSAHRWLKCTPSARIEERIPEKISRYAEEGTLAHEIAARYILGKPVSGDKEMLEYCKRYAEFVKEKDAEALLVETKVEFNEFVPEGYGTADCLIFSGSRLEVIDFKYGRGKRVDAYENPQMKLYALGAYSTYGILYDIEEIEMTIYQPRISDKPNSYSVRLEELLRWGRDYVKPRARLAYAGEGEFNPSEQTCFFCKAKNECRARAEYNLKLFDKEPLSAEEAGEILLKIDKTFIADLEKVVLDAILSGNEIKGWKVKAGRSTRSLGEEAEAVKVLKEAGISDIYKPEELLSLTQLEKRYGKQTIDELLADIIVRPAGKPTLERSG